MSSSSCSTKYTCGIFSWVSRILLVTATLLPLQASVAQAAEELYVGSPVFVNEGMGTPRYSHATVLLNDGRLMVVGGLDGGENPLRSCEIFDPETKTWSNTGNLRIRRWGIPARFGYPNGPSYTTTYLRDGRILVTGGINSGSVNLDDNGERWNPATGTWAVIDDRLATTRANHSAVLMGDGRVYISGGQDINSILFQDEIFDPETDTFSLAGIPTSIQTNRRNHQTVFVPNPSDPTRGHVLILAGLNAQDFTVIGINEAYDPDADPAAAITSLPDMNFRRFNFGVAYLGSTDQILLVAGGRNAGTQIASVEVLERGVGGQLSWRVVGPLPRAVSFPRLIPYVSSTGTSVLSVSGRASNGVINAIFDYRSDTETWCRSGLVTPVPMMFHTATADPFRNKVYLFGGTRNVNGVPENAAASLFYAGGLSIRLGVAEKNPRIVPPGGTLNLDAYIGNLTQNAADIQSAELTIDRNDLFGTASPLLGVRNDFTLPGKVSRRKSLQLDVPSIAEPGPYSLLITARLRNGTAVTEAFGFEVEQQ